jgi:hypothetical protein
MKKTCYNLSVLIRLSFLIFCVTFLNSCGVLKLLNSGTANIKYRVSEATLDNTKYEEKGRLTNPSISIRNVQHPSWYKNWDYNIRLTPSIHYDDQDYETGGTFIDPTNGLIVKRSDINIRRGITMANLKATLHTRAGAFTASAGFGGTMYKIDDGRGLNSIKTREIRRLDLVWYGFISDRFFVLTGPRYYKAGYETFEFAFRIGYFWGKINE